jgi:hypothetical protein
MVKIIMTADQTLMSECNKHVFLGFSGCAPKGLSAWLYTKIFSPPVEEESDYRVKYGHCGQRKVEAVLLQHGFTREDVAVVNPDKIENVVDNETKVLCITTHDPSELGPASTTFSDLSGIESFTGHFFKKLISNKAIRKYGLKVIVGGSGAW